MNREFPRLSIDGDRHSFKNDRYEIDVYKLIDLTKDHPSEELELQEVEATLTENCWTDGEGHGITPLEVIEAIQQAGSFDAAVAAYPIFAEHIRKIEQADTGHPILLHGREVIDGVHRLAKVKLNGGTNITSKVLSEIPSEVITKRFSKDQGIDAG